LDGRLLVDLQCGVALALLGLSLLAVPRAFLRVVRLQRAASDSSGVLASAATLAGAAVRWLIAPRWIVTMYIGYLLTEQAIELQTASHYGVGSQALYHALFALLPRDHRSLMWVNSVLGVLTIPLWATACARLLGDRRAGAVFALLLALVPLFIKNDNSDANQVPALFWLAGGLVLWDEYLEGGEGGPLLGALSLLALSSIARPEMPALVPALVALATVALAHNRVEPENVPARTRLSDPRLLVGVAVAAALVVPHALHVARSADLLLERDSLPGWSLARVRALGWFLAARNTLLSPTLYPVALVPLAALSLAERDAAARRRRLVVAAMALVALLPYVVDLCRANMARVHVPAALFATMLAAAGAVRLWDRARGVLPRVALVVAVAGTAVPTALRLWRPTNEQAEEVFLREAIARLPRSGGYTLVRLAREDRDRAHPDADFTHHHFPDYLVRPPVGGGNVSSATDWMAQPDFAAPAFFYWGMRCYAEFRPEGTPPPRGEALQPACRAVRERFRLEPVIEREVANRGDVWLEYYGDAPTLRLGLYRILPRTN
jgi:hypothetical protein